MRPLGRPVTDEWPADAPEWAMRGHSRHAAPGELVASFPIYPTREAVESAAAYLDAQRPDLPPVTILTRDRNGEPWRLAPVDYLLGVLD